MSDMMSTVIPKSDQLNADDLIGGKTMTITITAAKVKAGEEQPCTLNYQGDNKKPYKPCMSMRRLMIAAWGNDSQKYVGRGLRVFCDPNVRFGAAEVGGIRISLMSNLPEDKCTIENGIRKFVCALTTTRGVRKPYTVYSLEDVLAREAREAGKTSPAQTPAATIDPAVKKAGDDASSKGVESYTAWLAKLPPDVKATVKLYHQEWSAIAKAYVAPVADDIDFATEPQNEPPI